MTLNEFRPELVIRNPAPDAAAHGPAPGTTRAMTISNTRADPALAAAQAEAARTALLATGDALAAATKRAMEARAEGERRATVAIVADLRAMSALYSTGLPSVLATRYETGEHLKEVKLAAQEKETPNE
jgi:hypothetical protein